MAAIGGAQHVSAPSPFKQALGLLPGEPKLKDSKKAKSSLTAPLLLPLLSGGQKNASALTNLQVNNTFTSFSTYRNRIFKLLPVRAHFLLLSISVLMASSWHLILL